MMIKIVIREKISQMLVNLVDVDQVIERERSYICFRGSSKVGSY